MSDKTMTTPHQGSAGVQIEDKTMGTHQGSVGVHPEDKTMGTHQGSVGVQPEDKGKIICFSCRQSFTYPRGANRVHCLSCQRVYLVVEANNVAQVKCGGCATLLMYPNGAQAVKCRNCQFVTAIKLQEEMSSSKGGKSGKLKPHLDKDSTKSLNLTVLQRRDQFVEEILTTANHVTLYEFDINTSQWARKDIEGALFVVKRSTHPWFQFIVMNKKSPENFVENLLGDFEFENQNPYLMYRNEGQEVVGMWFYNKKECDEIADLFNRLINSYPKGSPGQEATPSRRLPEVPGTGTSSAVLEGALVKPATSTSTGHPEDLPIMKFFNEMHVNEGLQPDKAHNIHIPQVPPSPGTHPVACTWSFTDSRDQINSSNNTANLVNPSSFIAPSPSPLTPSYLVPPVSLTPTAYLHSLLKLDQPDNTPKLPALSPPTTLTPIPPAVSEHAHVDRERVKNALLKLTEDNQFVEMVYQALMKVCQP